MYHNGVAAKDIFIQYICTEDFIMINELLVAATAWSLESILQDRNVPYEFRDDEEYQYFLKV